MTVIAVQYDALNRAFVPLGNETARLFEDGELYFVILSDLGPDVTIESLDFRPLNIAHA